MTFNAMHYKPYSLMIQSIALLFSLSALFFGTLNARADSGAFQTIAVFRAILPENASFQVNWVKRNHPQTITPNLQWPLQFQSSDPSTVPSNAALGAISFPFNYLSEENTVAIWVTRSKPLVGYQINNWNAATGGQIIINFHPQLTDPNPSRSITLQVMRTSSGNYETFMERDGKLAHIESLNVNFQVSDSNSPSVRSIDPVWAD